LANVPVVQVVEDLLGVTDHVRVLDPDAQVPHIIGVLGIVLEAVCAVLQQLEQLSILATGHERRLRPRNVRHPRRKRIRALRRITERRLPGLALGGALIGRSRIGCTQRLERRSSATLSNRL
jgi:hypothetical protein